MLILKKGLHMLSAIIDDWVLHCLEFWHKREIRPQVVVEIASFLILDDLHQLLKLGQVHVTKPFIALEIELEAIDGWRGVVRKDLRPSHDDGNAHGFGLLVLSSPPLAPTSQIDV